MSVNKLIPFFILLILIAGGAYFYIVAKSPNTQVRRVDLDSKLNLEVDEEKDLNLVISTDQTYTTASKNFDVKETWVDNTLNLTILGFKASSIGLDVMTRPSYRILIPRDKKEVELNIFYKKLKATYKVTISETKVVIEPLWEADFISPKNLVYLRSPEGVVRIAMFSDSKLYTSKDSENLWKELSQYLTSYGCSPYALDDSAYTSAWFFLKNPEIKHFICAEDFRYYPNPFDAFSSKHCTEKESTCPVITKTFFSDKVKEIGK
ncbi:MAG: hypothetical protein AAB443_01110 [Patescibacteria group bacterium]